MKPFTYSRAADANQALATVSGKPQSKFLGSGTNLIDLMKMGVETPNELIDINRLPHAQIEELPDKGVRIGAMARNSDVAEHELIKTRYPVLSQALLSGASPQLRNVATVTKTRSSPKTNRSEITTMPNSTLDDLKLAWKELSLKLERQNALSVRQLKQEKLARFQSDLRPLVCGQLVQLVLGAIIV